jgi:lipopolysaccharide transport system ATP-binding protein
MSDVIIKVEGLGKKYTISHEKRQGYIALRDVISNKVKDLVKRKSLDFVSKEDFWALKDVNFEIKRGEAVGIIGRNGAGKSTLLKILSRITEPTHGRIELNGRIASLLEVGTGFHPELTGRENVFLNGAILGMSRAEIKRKFDEIIDFSGVEKFLDTPVKRYSSGMYVRLAFAVAAHLDPEILVIDEVLAVGDGEFQKKCLGKMDEVTKNGRTVIFVSHDMNAIEALTKRSILLKNGNTDFIGETKDVISKYISHNEKDIEHEYTAKKITGKPQVIGLSAININKDHNNIFYNGDPFTLEFNICLPEPVENLGISFQVMNEKQLSITHVWLFDYHNKPINLDKGTHKIYCKIPKLNLYQGSYTITTHLSELRGKGQFETIKEALKFKVSMKGMREYGWEDTAMYIEDFYWNIEV